MAIKFEIQDSNSLEFDLSSTQNLEFGTRDIIEVRQSGDYEDLTNKPSINGVTLVGNKTTEDLGIQAGVTSWNGQTGDVVYTPPTVPVQSVNGQTGDVVLNASNVGALPSNTPIPSKTSDLQNDSGYITGIDSTDVTSALGYTPYNATNPSGYVNATQAANAAPVQSVNGQTGAVSLNIPTKTSDLTNDSGYITSAPVQSVNSKTGTVVLSASDVNALPSDTPIHNVPSGGTSGQVLTKSSNSDYALEWTTPSGAVSSVNGQTGAVVLDAEDVGAMPDDTEFTIGYDEVSSVGSAVVGEAVTAEANYTPSGDATLDYEVKDGKLYIYGITFKGSGVKFTVEKEQ